METGELALQVGAQGLPFEVRAAIGANRVKGVDQKVNFSGAKIARGLCDCPKAPRRADQAGEGSERGGAKGGEGHGAGCVLKKEPIGGERDGGAPEALVDSLEERALAVQRGRCGGDRWSSDLSLGRLLASPAGHRPSRGV